MDHDASPKTLTVYGAAGCCLCDDAMAILEPLSQELGFELVYTPIDGDDALEAQWREEIPVGILDGHKVFKYRVDEQLLRRRA